MPTNLGTLLVTLPLYPGFEPRTAASWPSGWTLLQVQLERQITFGFTYINDGCASARAKMSQFFNMKIAVKVGNNLHRRHLHADTPVMFEAPWGVSANGNDTILQ